MLSKQIEKAQKKVEEQNFLARKTVLEYDDVMNEQRRVIYAYRDEVLEGKSLGEEARREVAAVIERTVERVHRRATTSRTGTSTACSWRSASCSRSSSTREDLDAESIDRDVAHRAASSSDAMARYDDREQALGEELMGALERFLLLQIIDERWREHLFDMDYLREGIHLRGFAQIDPLVAYKNEAFTLFGDLMNSVWTDFARMIFNVEVNVEEPNGAARRGSFEAAGSATARRAASPTRAAHSAAGAGALASAAAAAGAGGAANAGDAREEAMPVVEQRVLDDEQQVGRNDPCWCGSGKKFKKCHGA